MRRLVIVEIVVFGVVVFSLSWFRNWFDRNLINFGSIFFDIEDCCRYSWLKVFGFEYFESRNFFVRVWIRDFMVVSCGFLILMNLGIGDLIDFGSLLIRCVGIRLIEV